jgi:hypothetical protein
MAPSGLYTTGIKKGLAALGTQLGHYRVLPKRLQDVQATTVRLYNAALTQLTTPGHGYSGDMTRQDGTTGRAIFRAVEQ